MGGPYTEREKKADFRSERQDGAAPKPMKNQRQGRHIHRRGTWGICSSKAPEPARDTWPPAQGVAVQTRLLSMPQPVPSATSPPISADEHRRAPAEAQMAAASWKLLEKGNV